MFLNLFFVHFSDILPENFENFSRIDILKKGENINTPAEEQWSDTIKVQCLNCRKTKEYGNEKV